MREPTPAPGDGVTYCHPSDRYPGTVSRVSASGKTFWYRQDNVYPAITPNPDGPEIRVHRVKDGWRDARGLAIRVGVRELYLAPEI